MKYRLTYLFAFVIALVASLAFQSMPVVATMFTYLSGAFIAFGAAFSCVFAALTITGSVAALRRTGSFAKAFFKTVLWSLIAVVIGLALTYAVSAFLLPLFGFSPSGISAAAIAESRSHVTSEVPDLISIENIGLIFQNMSFVNIFFIMTILIAVSYLLGYFIKPDVEIVRPAYVLMNSLTEVGYRFGNVLVKIYNVLICFISGYWFSVVMRTSILKEAMWLLIGIAAVGVLFMILILPLMYLIGVKFKRKNPFPVIFSSFSVSATSFFTGNVFFTLPVFEIVARRENDIPKKFVSSMAPFLTIFTHVGVAIVSYMLAFVIVQDAGLTLSVVQHIMLPVLCLALSIISGFNGDMGVFFTTTIVLQYVGAPTSMYIPLIIALTPILKSMASFIDTNVAFYGVCALGVQEDEIASSIF